MLWQVKAELADLDPYFAKLGDAMVTWIEAWQQLNPTSEQGFDAAAQVSVTGGAK